MSRNQNQAQTSRSPKQPNPGVCAVPDCKAGCDSPADCPRPTCIPERADRIIESLHESRARLGFVSGVLGFPTANAETGECCTGDDNVGQQVNRIGNLADDIRFLIGNIEKRLGV